MFAGKKLPLTSIPPKPPSNLVPTRSAVKKRELGHELQFSPTLVNSQILPTGENNVAARESINATSPEQKNIDLNPFMSTIFAEIEALSEDRDGMIRLVNQINSYVTNPQTFTLAEKEDQLSRVKGDKQKEMRINAIYELVKRVLQTPLKKFVERWNQSLMLKKIDSRYPASNYPTGGTRRKRSKSRRKKTTYVRRKPTFAKASR